LLKVEVSGSPRLLTRDMIWLVST